MKSQNARTRGGAPQIRMHDQIEPRPDFRYRRQNGLETVLRAAEQHRQGRQTGPDFTDARTPSIELAAGCDPRARCGLPKPSGRLIVGHFAVEFDHRVMIQVFIPLRPAMALHVGLARIDAPARIGDLAGDQRRIAGLMHAHRDLGLSLRKIKPAIGHDEIDTKLGVLCVERLDHRHEEP